MLMRLKGVPADAMLVQRCDREYCGATTLHGPLARLKWVWADDDEASSAVRPEVGCRGCGMPCGDTFELETVAPAKDRVFTDEEWAELKTHLDEAGRLRS